MAFFWHHDLEFSTWLATLLIGTGMAESMMPLISLQHLIGKAKISIARINEVLGEKKRFLSRSMKVCRKGMIFVLTT